MSIAFAHPRGRGGDRQGFLAFLELGDVDAGVAGFLLEGEMLLGRGNDEFGVVDQEFLEGALAFLLGDREHDVKEGAPVLDEGAAGFKSLLLALEDAIHRLLVEAEEVIRGGRDVVEVRAVGCADDEVLLRRDGAL